MPPTDQTWKIKLEAVQLYFKNETYMQKVSKLHGYAISIYLSTYASNIYIDPILQLLQEWYSHKQVVPLKW